MEPGPQLARREKEAHVFVAVSLPYLERCLLLQHNLAHPD